MKNNKTLDLTNKHIKRFLEGGQVISISKAGSLIIILNDNVYTYTNQEDRDKDFNIIMDSTGVTAW
jgi:hypothetical protein